jgi:hypothetical protein
MFQRIHRIIATAACGLTVALLSGPCAHAADTLFSGQAAKTPWVRVWVDTEKGTQLDPKAAKAVQSQFAGTEWTAQDDGQVVVTKDGKSLVGGSSLSFSDDTFFLFHGRTGNQIIDGRFYSYSDDPSNGYAILYVTELAADGHGSRTSLIQIELEFPQE